MTKHLVPESWTGQSRLIATGCFERPRAPTTAVRRQSCGGTADWTSWCLRGTAAPSSWSAGRCLSPQAPQSLHACTRLSPMAIFNSVKQPLATSTHLWGLAQLSSMTLMMVQGESTCDESASCVSSSLKTTFRAESDLYCDRRCGADQACLQGCSASRTARPCSGSRCPSCARTSASRSRSGPPRAPSAAFPCLHPRCPHAVLRPSPLHRSVPVKLLKVSRGPLSFLKPEERKVDTSNHLAR